MLLHFPDLRLSTRQVAADLTNKVSKCGYQNNAVRNMMREPEPLQVFFFNVVVLNAFNKP
ncbi:hypothetical protein C9418_24150 [Rhizobium sp. SEMIA 4032]|nr:hypothetical protein C9418_24150 [Rhizobium sp. SEMIA 4032]